MKFWFLIGTAAELIKMLPVIDEAESRGIEWYLISSGQSGQNLWKQYSDFNLPEDRIIRLIRTDRDISTSWMAIKWLGRALLRSKSDLAKVIEKTAGRTPDSTDYWFVHGDTFTTLLGTIYGRRFKTRVVHVEAGMRSHDIFNPFPEEINRRLVSRMADYHMAPDQNAAKNLAASGVKKNVTVTDGNTVLDALDVSLRRFKPVDLPEGDYAIANIHRFENLNLEDRWHKILDVLIETAKGIPVYFVLMPNTKAKLEQDVESRKRLEQGKIRLLPRLPFSQFAHFMQNSKFLISDGGSNQQESYHLGIPCLILREKTESVEGIGGCCVLSQFSDAVIDDFLKDPQKFKREPVRKGKRPTDIIFSALSLDHP